MRYIDYGLGVFDRRAFEIVPEGEAFDLAQVYQEMLRRDQLAAIGVFERFYEIGSLRGPGGDAAAPGRRITGLSAPVNDGPRTPVSD